MRETVVILCMAGMNVVVALQTLVPQFLLRFGMELRWIDRMGVLIAAFALVNLVVTLWFQASVDAQRGAYAASVLALISNASIVSTLDRWRRRSGSAWPLRVPWGFGLISGFFVLSTAAVVYRSPSALFIAFAFILTILLTSVFSRALRVREYRTTGFEFVDAASKALWDRLKHLDFPVLVPHRPGRRERDSKERSIRLEHQLAPDVEVVFIEVHIEDPSDFYQDLLIEVLQEEKRFVIKVTRSASVAHAIAAVALEMSRFTKPPSLHFGWSERKLIAEIWSYLVFGEGNVPWKAREIMIRKEPDPERRPRVIIG